MNFIDISSWQRGLDLEKLFASNPKLDGVIVKTSGGATYTQDTADPWIQWLIRNDKPFGFYHYLNDDYRYSSGKSEARWFVENCRNYFGKGVPAADYEGTAVTLGPNYLKEFLDEVYKLTGVKSFVYASLSVIQSQAFGAIARAGYPLWLAQYANYNFTSFQDSPWQSGSYAPFDKITMHQYASTGRLAGWSGSKTEYDEDGNPYVTTYGNLDMDKFYGSRADWDALAKGSSVPEKKKVSPEIVRKVLDNEYGVNPERREKLTADGYNPSEVQAKVNELYGIAGNANAVLAKAGEYKSLVVDKFLK